MKKTLSLLLLLFYVNTQMHGQNFINGQNAAFSIFASSPSASGLLGNTASNLSLGGSRSCFAIDSKHHFLYVADYFGNRVLRFAYPLTSNMPAANLVFGQSLFTTNATGLSATALNGPQGLAVDTISGTLWVLDMNNHRILKFASAHTITANNPAANVVLGQTNFTSNNQATTQSGLKFNTSVVCGNLLHFDHNTGALWVSDNGNMRVLRFDNANLKITGASADAVLGQTLYTTATAATTSSNFGRPDGLTNVGTSLFVSDNPNNRILRYDNVYLLPNGSPATAVLGQGVFTSNGAGTTSFSLSSPMGLSSDLVKLYVADVTNKRVLIYDNAATNTTANVVLLSGNLTTIGSGAVTPSTGGINTSVSMDYIYGQLVVSDNQNSRVLVFSGCANMSISATSTVCSGNSTTLTGIGANSYSWSTGSSASTVAINPTVTTVYSYTGAIYSCTMATAKTITVYTTPTISVVSNTNVCPSQTVMITATGALSYTWAGNISFTNGVAFSPITAGLYTVTGDNGCGTATAVTNLTMNPIPNVVATVSTPSLCSGSSGTFVANGASTYTWFGTSPPLNGQAHYPTVTSQYTVIGTSALGCTASATSSIIVVQTPTNFPTASPGLICIGSSATLTAPGATNYTWLPGPSNSATYIVTPTASTNYTVIKSNANCVDIKTVNVIVNQLPQPATLASSLLVCASKPVTITAVGGTIFSWAPTGGNGQVAIVNPTITTNYTVTVSDGTCVNIAIRTISVNPNPTITINTSSLTLCQGESRTLTLLGATGYTWTTPASMVGSNATSATVSPLFTTTYSVTGVNQYTCYSGKSETLTVNPTPTVGATANRTLVCINGSTTLTATGAHTYTWSNGSLNTVTIVNPAVTQIYTVTGFYNSTNCNNTKTVSVSVFSPTFQVPATASACIGGTITLTATGANTYTWNGNTPFQSISVSPSSHTVYFVAATSVSNGVNCNSTNSVNVSIYLNPNITAMTTRSVICKGEYAYLVGVGGTTYSWSTFQQGGTVEVQPFNTLTTYTVLGADENGCSGTASVTVKVLLCVGIDLNQENDASQIMVYPNPGNGEFQFQSYLPENSELEVYNALGELVIKEKIVTPTNKLNMFGYANGVYTLRLSESEGTIRTVKIIKQ